MSFLAPEIVLEPFAGWAPEALLLKEVHGFFDRPGMNAGTPALLSRALFELLNEEGCAHDSSPIGVLQSIRCDPPPPMGRALDFAFNEVGEKLLVFGGQWVIGAKQIKERPLVSLMTRDPNSLSEFKAFNVNHCALLPRLP